MVARSKYFSNLKEDFLLEETKPGESTEYMLDILVDADILVVLVNSNKQNHKKALSISETLQKKGCIWYISPFTIGEVVTEKSQAPKLCFDWVGSLRGRRPLNASEAGINKVQ